MEWPIAEWKPEQEHKHHPVEISDAASLSMGQELTSFSEARHIRRRQQHKQQELAAVLGVN